MTKKNGSAVLPEHVQYCIDVLVAYLEHEPYPEPDFPNGE
jgi:hypothetical protein